MYSAKLDIRIWSGCLGHFQKEVTGCLFTNMFAVVPWINISQVRMISSAIIAMYAFYDTYKLQCKILRSNPTGMFAEMLQNTTEDPPIGKEG